MGNGTGWNGKDGSGNHGDVALGSHRHRVGAWAVVSGKGQANEEGPAKTAVGGPILLAVGMIQPDMNAVSGFATIASGLGVVSAVAVVGYWVQYWMFTSGPQAMADALFWTFITLLCFGVGIVANKAGGY